MAGITFDVSPYDMVEQYCWLCNGGLIVPLYASDEELEIFQTAADAKGMELVDFLNSLAPSIEEKIKEICGHESE